MAEKPWSKFAILGSTYARALGNAAQRSGGRVAPQLLQSIGAQPQARLMPGLAEKARAPGALSPTPQQSQLQSMTHKLPETGEGVPGAPGEGHATQRFFFNQMFGNRAQMAPAPAAPTMTAQGTPAQTAVASPRARGKTGAALPLAAGIAAPLALGGGLLATKPGIKADLSNFLSGQGDIHQKDVSQKIPEAVQAQASRAAQALSERGLDPASLRIAVDAPPGAGKTVLSRAMAKQMGIRHHGLDWRPHMKFHQLLGGGDIEKMPYAPRAGEILEHQQLLRSYDPETFDVALHIHKDPAAIKQQLLQRGRGARTHDLLDYDKSLGVGQKAFETLGGEAIDLGDGVMMKVRPREGWGDALDRQLAQAGIDSTGLSRHEKLLSLYGGQRTTGAGWIPYAKSPFSGAETAAIGASVPLGMMAARALARHPL